MSAGRDLVWLILRKGAEAPHVANVSFWNRGASKDGKYVPLNGSSCSSSGFLQTWAENRSHLAGCGVSPCLTSADLGLSVGLAQCRRSHGLSTLRGQQSVSSPDPEICLKGATRLSWVRVVPTRYWL